MSDIWSFDDDKQFTPTKHLTPPPPPQQQPARSGSRRNGDTPAAPKKGVGPVDGPPTRSLALSFIQSAVSAVTAQSAVQSTVKIARVLHPLLPLALAAVMIVRLSQCPLSVSVFSLISHSALAPLPSVHKPAPHPQAALTTVRRDTMLLLLLRRHARSVREVRLSSIFC